LPRETKRRETQVSCADDSNAPVSGSGREHLEDAAVHRNDAAVSDHVLLGAKLRFAPCVVYMNLDPFRDGVPNATRGEIIVAFVNSASPLSESSLCAYVKEKAASFKVPHHIFFRKEDQLPRLASGKVAKYRLVEEARRELGN